MSTPLVTVILTVFKRTEYLEGAIRSVLAQTMASWECIVTDDANTSAAREICARFAADARVRYRANERTLGAPLNIAAALRQARGEYVVILNDDDLLEPRMLDLLVRPLESDAQIVLCLGNYKIMDAVGSELAGATRASLRRRGRESLRPGLLGHSVAFALHRNVMAAIGCAFRRSACDPAWLMAEVGGAYDYWLAVMLSAKGRFFFVPETVMAWRAHVNSTSARHSQDVFKSEVVIYERLSQNLRDEPLLAYARRQHSHFLCLRGKELLAYWDPIEARSVLLKSLSLRWSAISCFLLVLSFWPKWARNQILALWHRTIRFRTACGFNLFRTG